MSNTLQSGFAAQDSAQDGPSAAETTDTTPASQEESAGQDGNQTQASNTADAQEGVEDEGQDATRVDQDDTDPDDAEDLGAEEQDHFDEKARRALSKTRREAANLRTRLKTEALRADKAEVALAAGLPFDAVKFLTGDSREELETNAADLLAMLGYSGRVTPSGTPREVGVAPGAQGAVKTSDLDSIGARIYNHFN